MDDLISRQAAIDAADKIIKRDTSGNNVVVQAMIAWKCYVEHLPSAQPERKTGRWIDDNCSECGQYVHHGDMRNYCPQCGAKMEVEHE